MKQITINFGDLVNELNKNNVRLGFVNTNMKIICLFDDKYNIYPIEVYYLGSCLDSLIKNNVIADFTLTENSLIENWQKEIWEIEDMKSFIERQQKYWS